MTDTKILAEQFKSHRQASDKEFVMLHADVGMIKKDIREIKENHLSHIQDKISKMEIAFAGLKTKVESQGKLVWLLVAQGFAVFSGILYIILQK